MSAKLIAVKTPTDWGRGKVHLGLLQDPAVFLARNGDPYNLPPLSSPPNTQQYHKIWQPLLANNYMLPKKSHSSIVSDINIPNTSRSILAQRR